MAVLQRRNVNTELAKPLACLAGRAHRQEVELVQTCPVPPCTCLWWLKKPKKTHWSLWKVILKPDLVLTSPSYWKALLLSYDWKKAFPVSSPIYLRLFYSHFVLASPITSIFIFLFQLCILMLELLKPIPISLWGTDSRISGTVAVLIMLERIYQTVSLFQSDILLLALQLSFTKLRKINSGCFSNVPTIIPSPTPQQSLPTFFKITPLYLPMQTTLQNWTITFHFFMAVCVDRSQAYAKRRLSRSLNKTQLSEFCRF